MTFSFGERVVRTVLKAGETWFVATDVCAVLEHTNTAVAVGRLDDDEKGVTNVYTLGGEQAVNIISESGLYALILTSRKPQAKAFRRWITGEVLPQIRRTGSYQKEERAGRLPGVEAGPKLIAPTPTVVLPGPGRYVALVRPDGTIHVRGVEYDSLLDEVATTEALVLCHSLKMIAGQWTGTEQQRSMGMDPYDSFVYRALEISIRNGATLAEHFLRVQAIPKH